MKFGIVGFGRFGQLWAEALLPFGRVLVYDKHSTSQPNKTQIKITSLAEVAQVNILFILVPISEFENSCLEISKVLHPTTLVVDCCSVKIHPVNVMHRIFPPSQPLLATHPLFGPDSVKKNGGIADHKIVLCPASLEQNIQVQLRTILEKMGLQILIASPEDHDRQMANTQGLVHFLGRGLQALNLTQQEFATPDFQALLNINNMVANDTWQLFLDMQRYNPYVQAMRQKLIKQLIAINLQIEEGNIVLTLEQLRARIATVDAEIIEKLAERQKTSRQIGELKSQQGKEIIDISQENKLFEYYEGLSEKYHLQPSFVKRLFKMIIAYSRKVQKR
jgi:prephenate dehydrogenase